MKLKNKIKLARQKLAELKSCVKCGYGFAGKKPVESFPGGPTKRVNLEADDLLYNETKPCPNCGYLAKPSSGDEEQPDGEPSSFGDQYYVYTDLEQEFFSLIGPFYDRADAEEAKSEVEEAQGELEKWTGRPHEFYGEVDHAATRIISTSDPHLGKYLPGGEKYNKDDWSFEGRSREFKKQIKEMIDDAKSEYFERRDRDLNPNVASKTSNLFKIAKLNKFASSVLENPFVQQELAKLKDLLKSEETAKRRPGLQFRQRFQGDAELSGPTYRDIPVYDYDFSSLEDSSDPEQVENYKQQVNKTWQNAKAAVELALQELEGAPKNWKQYLADIDAPNPGEWLYNVESFIEASYEKTPEGKAYSTKQKTRSKVKDFLNTTEFKEAQDFTKLTDLVELLDTDMLRQLLKIIKFRDKKVKKGEDKLEVALSDLLFTGNRMLQQQRTSVATNKIRSVRANLSKITNKILANPSFNKKAQMTNLKAIEDMLERMEEKGLENTERYRELDQLANELAEKQQQEDPSIEKSKGKSSRPNSTKLKVDLSDRLEQTFPSEETGLDSMRNKIFENLDRVKDVKLKRNSPKSDSAKSKDTKSKDKKIPEKYEILHRLDDSLPYGEFQPISVTNSAGEKKRVMVYQPTEEENAAYKQFQERRQSEDARGKTGKIVLLEGRDDREIAEIREMLETIVSQPADTMSAKKEVQFAKSILGKNKTAATLEELFGDNFEKQTDDKVKKTFDDYTEEELSEIEERLGNQEQKTSSYLGWERTTSAGKVYVLSSKQLGLISYFYENALMRHRGESPHATRQKQKQVDKDTQEKTKQDLREKLERFNKKKQEEKQTMLSDDDLDDLGLDLDSFDKGASCLKLIKIARTAVLKCLKK